MSPAAASAPSSATVGTNCASPSHDALDVERPQPGAHRHAGSASATHARGPSARPPRRRRSRAASRRGPSRVTSPPRGAS